METEKKIVEYLKQKYNPVAIVLHGSRASAHASPDSDWDLYVFTSEKSEASPEYFDGENLDLHGEIFPFPETKIFDTFENYLSHARVLYDETNGEINSLIQKAQEAARTGYSLSEKRRGIRESYFRRLLTRLIRYQEQPLHFQYYFASAYEVSINWWFHFQGEWSLSMHSAIPAIESRDPQYHAWLSMLASASTSKQKVEALKLIFKHLFKKEYE